MKETCSRRLAAMLACALFFCTLFFSAYPAVEAAPMDRISTVQQKAVENTPRRNIFKIKGSSKEFILLDSSAGGAGYFVLAKDSYGPKAFDPANKARFDLENPSNVAYFLNHEFIEEGNGDGNRLPQEILEHIDYEHEWPVEAGSNISNCPEDYTVRCGIALMSQTEWLKYLGEFGVRDDMPGAGWWLRTSRGAPTGSAGVLQSSFNPLGTTAAWDSNYAKLNLRPCFYLKPSFFEQVGLETVGMGSGVKKALMKELGREGLSRAGYTGDEIERISDSEFDLEEQVSLLLPETIGNFYYQDSLSAKVSLLISWREPKTYTVSYSVDGVKRPSKQVRAVPNYPASYTLALAGLPVGVHELEVSVTEESRIVKEFKQEIALITRAQDQFMGTLTHKGVSTHFGQENNNGPKDRELMNMLGIKAFRDEVSWHKVELVKGTLDQARGDQFVPGLVSQDGMTMIMVADFNNDLYSGLSSKTTADSTKYGPRTAENFEGFARYAAFMAASYPDVKYLQVWNEPHGNGFWKPDPNHADYVYLMQLTEREVHKVRPDMTVIGGVFGVSSLDFMDHIIQYGGYSFYDSIAYHPYMYPEKVDDVYRERSAAMDNKVYREYGGWKTLGVSEIGWPTFQGERGSSLEKQAVESVKQYVIGDEKRLIYNTIYDFRNDGTNPEEREHNFGLVYQDYRAKPAALAVKKHIEATAGAVYLGKADCGDEIEMHGYLKDGLPLFIAWTKGEPVQLDLDGDHAKIIDLYGNRIATADRVVLKEEPVYLEGLGGGWVNRTVRSAAVSQLTQTLEYYGDGLPAAEKRLIADQLEGVKALTEGKTLPDAARVRAFLDEYYRQAGEVLLAPEKNEDGFRRFGKLFSMQWAAETVANLYAASVDQDTPTEIGSRQTYESVQSEMDAEEASVVGGRYEFSEAMLSYGLEYLKKAETVQGMRQNNRMKAGFIVSRDYLAEQVFRWTRQAMRIEPVSGKNIVVQLPSSQRTFYNFAENTIQLSIYNYGRLPYQGRLELCDAEGNAVFLTEEVGVRPGESLKLPVSFHLRNNSSDSGSYTLRTYSRERVIGEQPIHVSVKNRAEVSLDAASQTLDDLREITFQVTNTFNSALSGTVEITGPDGWTFAQETQSFTAAKAASQAVRFTVTGKTARPFHQYSFQAVVRDGNGDVLASGKFPLNFAIATKAGHPYDLDTFTGAIDDWSSAYPVAINPPENPDDEQAWKDSNAAARVYTRWDEEHLYILADVYDDAHHQEQTPERIWDGDSIQISLDPLNDKSAKYQSDDYELGYAKTEQGEVGYCWINPDSSRVAQIQERQAAVVRDEAAHRTKYLIKIPKSAIPPMELKHGVRFGINYVLNDADLISRERFFEVTPGTAKVKSPILYYNWTLLGKE